MIRPRVICRAQFVDYMNQMEFLIAELDMSGEIKAVAQPLTFTQVLNNGDILEPTFSLHRDAALKLGNNMIQAGLRPDGYLDKEPLIKALQSEVTWLRGLVNTLMHRQEPEPTENKWPR